MAIHLVKKQWIVSTCEVALPAREAEDGVVESRQYRDPSQKNEHLENSRTRFPPGHRNPQRVNDATCPDGNFLGVPADHIEVVPHGY